MPEVETEANLGHAGATYEIVAPRRRFEDRRLLLGQGRFVGDLAGAGYDGLHAAFVRSPFAHVRIVSMDVAAARAAPSVVGIVTAADLSTRRTCQSARHLARRSQRGVSSPKTLAFCGVS